MKPSLLLTVMSLSAGNISAIAQTKDTIYSTGTNFHTCSYSNNKKNGKETYTWPNKKMMMTGINKDDQMEGEWLGYYRNGQVAGDVVYANGQEVSGTFYNEDGSKNKKIEGTVVVQFIVDEEGNPLDIKVVRPVNPLLDAEAVRVISQPKDCEAAVDGGRLVKSYKKQPIVFRLQAQ